MKQKPVLFDQKRLHAMMDRKGVDALIVRGVENSKYLSGFFHNGANLGYRPFCVFYFRDPAIEPAFIVPAVDLHLAMDNTWIKDVRAYAMAEFFTDLDVHFYEDFFQAATAVMADRKPKSLRVGTEGDALTYGFREKFYQWLQDAGHKPVDVAYDLEIVRIVKTPEEIVRLRKATEITVKAHESFREAIRPGNTDDDLHRAATMRMMQEGAHQIRFINIGCGPRTSFAAHNPFPIGHTMKYGDFVKVDMGAIYGGYYADFVRSYFIGETTQRQKDIWKWLNEVQVETGLSLKPGMIGGDIFDSAYRKISKHLENFPREFIGHGIGLGSHEQPRMNHVNRVELEANAVVCLEFSYYHDGVRHHTEDTFLVKEGSVEMWTKDCPRELVVPV
ncbi:MAG: aminopeptidase P family protein [Burkholderiales bacterium]|nr:aminopeptidase P family protein [Burkholderiales bacterium]